MISPNKTRVDTRHTSLRRWVILLGLVILIPLYGVVLRGWLVNLSKGIWVFVDSILWVAAGVAAYLIVDRLLRWKDEREALADELTRVEKQAAEASKKQQTIFHISQLFNQASDEVEVIQLTLRLSRDLVGARGASYVPLDDRAHPMPPLTTGDIPSQLSDDWLQYLATASVRQRCATCRDLGHVTTECPLLEAPMGDVEGMYCLPFTRRDRDFGMLNIYLPDIDQIEAHTKDLLNKIIDEATLALEGIRLRKRELATLQELQSARERTDLEGLVSILLTNLNETLEADYSRISVWDGEPRQNPLDVHVGELPASASSLVDGILQTVLSSRQPVLIGDVSGNLDAPPGLRALMAAPLICSNQSVMGVLVVASRHVRAFNQRQLSMLQTIASQTALVVQNVNLIAELEYKTMIEERTRLAREIHDGLAQTLGFLKLKMAQMMNYADHGDYERLLETIPVCHDTLAEAYQEVRQAIDGLRIQSNESGIEGWLRQAAAEFQENSGLRVNIIEPVESQNLPPEVHAQLIRIVQEALNNVRKHARAQQVWVSCQEVNNDLILEVRDDGSGFEIEDIPRPSRHGMQGMRERADLIGADFQIISRPMEGTAVRLRLPLALVGKNL